MARKERYLVGLDVGTSKVTVVVGEILDSLGVDIVGIGVAESRGMRRGVVVNLERIELIAEEANLFDSKASVSMNRIFGIETHHDHDSLAVRGDFRAHDIAHAHAVEQNGGAVLQPADGGGVK